MVHCYRDKDEALGAHVQQNLTIPRRGHIGKNGYATGIYKHYDYSGYGMSESRHTRMNAGRIRQHNQDYKGRNSDFWLPENGCSSESLSYNDQGEISQMNRKMHKEEVL